MAVTSTRYKQRGSGRPDQEKARTYIGHDALTTAILLVDPAGSGLDSAGARTEDLFPHNRWEPGDYISLDSPSPYQLGTARAEVFAKGS